MEVTMGSSNDDDDNGDKDDVVLTGSLSRNPRQPPLPACSCSYYYHTARTARSLARGDETSWFVVDTAGGLHFSFFSSFRSVLRTPEILAFLARTETVVEERKKGGRKGKREEKQAFPPPTTRHRKKSFLT